MNKLRVGVLMGGKSVEREVSFNSGRTVCDHLDSTRYEVIPLFHHTDGTVHILPWRFLHRGKTTDFVHRLKTEATTITWDNLNAIVDFMYLAMHGRYAEDGTLQGMLELLGIPYLGTKLFGSALCMDKVMLKKFLQQAGIAVPKGIALNANKIKHFEQYKTEIFNALESQKITFPCIVKPAQEGSSLGITVVFNKRDLHKALQHACYIQPGIKQNVLVEEKIEGMEFSCILLSDYHTGKPIILPPTEIVPEDNTHFYDYEQKYMPGRALEFTPARCSTEALEKIQQTCLQTMQVLSMHNFARIDGFLTPDNRVIIVDPNTITGMGPATFLFREAAEKNMGHAQLINHLIETELYQDNRFAQFIHAMEKRDKDVEQKKLRVAVIFGGTSNEKEISLESGRNICYKLSPEKFSVMPLFLNKNMQLYHITQRILLRNCTTEIELELTPKMCIAWNDLPTIADFVFLGLHGGQGENGTIQGTLELLGLAYNGSSVLTSALCMNKFKTNQLLKTVGFDVPHGILLAKSAWEKDPESVQQQIKKELSFPIIVKPYDDGCSVLVQKAKNNSQLKKSITRLFAAGKTDALIEECIEGAELTVGVIGNDAPHALIPSQAMVQKDILSMAEKFLPGAGENQTPAPLAQASLKLVQKTMENVFSALGCKGYARIDCFYQNATRSPTGKERVIILEINTLPALTPATCLFHQAAEQGIKPMELIDTIVQLGLEQHGRLIKVKSALPNLAKEKQANPLPEAQKPLPLSN